MPQKAKILKVRIKDKGARALLKNDAIARTKERAAAAKRDLEGSSRRRARYDVDTKTGPARTRSRIYANTASAKTDVAENPAGMIAAVKRQGGKA